MLEKAASRLLDGRHKYSAARGEPHLRTTIANKYTARCGRPFGPEHVLYSLGGQVSIALLVQALVEQGDEVLVPSPYYITYGPMAVAAGVQLVQVPLSPDNDFRIRPEDVAARITPKSRMLMLNTPQNPTGMTLTREEIRGLCEVAAEHDLWIVADEVYDDYIYEGEFSSPLDDPEFADRTLAIGSMSKAYAVPGWRCGWIIGPADILARTERLFEGVLFSSPPFLQDAVVFALENTFPENDAIRATLARRARELPRRLSQLPGIRVPAPQGGIFLFADIRETDLSGNQFTQMLYETEKVSAMPGEAFGMGGEGHVRICFAGQEAEMEEACNRITRFAQSIG